MDGRDGHPFHPSLENIHVYFKKGDTKIRLQELSSGEQQIVFRGTYLLRDIKKTLNGTVLIDEPEVSLHPR